MLDLELDTMSAKELRELRDLVDQAIGIVTQREKADLVAKMAAMAAEHGLSLSDLAEGGAPSNANGADTAKPAAKTRRAKASRPADS